MVPEISVIVPVYNREKTLRRSLESVLAQTCKNIEVIVVDDCSTDSSRNIANSIADRDKRVRVISLGENYGAAYCRNYGVNLAVGAVIAFQDSDDVWRPNRLEVQIEAMRSKKAVVVIGRFDKHGYGRDDGISPSSELKEGFIDFEIVLKGGLVATPSILVERQLMLDNPFDTDLKWCEDYEWSIRIAERAEFYLVDEVVVDVYLQTNSVTLVNDDKQIPFFEKMLSAHQATLDAVPWFHADILSGYAKQLILSGKDGSHYYLLAYQRAHRGRDLLKLVLSKIGVIKYVFKW